MLDEMLLLTADDNGNNDSLAISALGSRVLSFDTGGCPAQLSKLVISGYSEGCCEIGYTDEEGRCLVELRIHGENFMDGREFVRLMKASGSPAYGGEYDEDHFIYRASDSESYDVVTIDHMALPNNAAILSMTATLEEDIKNGGRLVSGLHFKYSWGTPTAISAQSSGVGEVTMSGSKMSGHVYNGLVHKAVESYMELPIRYDSVSLSEGTTVIDLPYEGRSEVLAIDYPILSDMFGLSDELECVSGKLTRRIGFMVIDESTTIEQLTYSGVDCYRIMLPEAIGDGVVTIDEFYDGSIEAFIDYDYTLYVPSTRDRVYIRLMEEDLDGAKEILTGKRILYPLRSEKVFKLDTKIDPTLLSGKNYIEVCSPSANYVAASYKIKE